MARHANIMSFDSVLRDKRTKRQSSSISAHAFGKTPQKGRRIPLSSDEPEVRYRLAEQKDILPRVSSAESSADISRSISVQSEGSARKRTRKPLGVDESSVDSSPKAVSPTPVLQSYDEFLEEEEEAEVANGAAPKTAKEKRQAKRDRRKKAAIKEKAERKFNKTYGNTDAGAGEGGPRAAVYKGQMGRSHKRSTRLQQSIAASTSSALQSFEIKRPKSLSTKKIIAGAIAACFLFACLFLYEPARIYYQEMREVARLEIEYEAVVERNEAIEFDVKLLQTERGITDKAREMLGWVPPEEHAGSVVGAEFTTNSNFSAHVVKEAIKPPVTWYSGILDPIFGVS